MNHIESLNQFPPKLLEALSQLDFDSKRFKSAISNGQVDESLVDEIQQTVSEFYSAILKNVIIPSTAYAVANNGVPSDATSDILIEDAIDSLTSVTVTSILDAIP